MPEFETISLQEAQARTMSGRQGRIINEYVSFIQQLPQGQAGKLHLAENEKPTTIRRRLVAAAKALKTRLVIKRSGEDLYFWREGGVEKQDRPRRGRRRQRHEETAAPDLPFREPEEIDQEVAEEESPELG